MVCLIIQDDLESLFTVTPILDNDSLNTTTPVRRIVNRPANAASAFGSIPYMKVDLRTNVNLLI